jgi:ABC-type transport system involved in multi-copper enzyme maturation permease subunit
MSPLVEASIIFGRELRKNFRSAKGITLAILTLLGGAGTALLMTKINASTGHANGAKLPVELLAQVYARDTAEWLSTAPLMLLLLLNVTTALCPFLIALMGFDSVAGDIQHRTVRYWTLRSRRASYFIGKWVGLWATAAVVTFAMDLMIWIVCIVKDEAAVGTTLAWGLRFWTISVPLCAIWSGIAVFVSALFRAPIVALLVTFATFAFLLVASAVFTTLKIEPLAFVFPNRFDQLLLVADISRFALGALASLGMAAIYVIGGSLIFARRDV